MSRDITPITVKFPKINKALAKDLKDEPINSPLRGVIVLNQKAIAFNRSFCVVIDLYDYFVIDCGIESDDELLTLEGVLMYMEQKVFSSEFWEELTKAGSLKMKNGSLYVENTRYSKDLHYKEIEIDLIPVIEQLTKISSMEENMVNCISLNFGVLNTIYSVLSTDFKSDDIIFSFNRQDNAVKFTFRKKKHVYGFIMPNYEASQESFKFDNLEHLVSETTDLLEELKAAVPPPPPEEENKASMEVVKDEEEENDNQNKIQFDE